jgi:CRISPR-associated protein (TIGR03984 family)
MNESKRQVIGLEAPKPDDEAVAWLEKQMSDERPWLLAHADDGVIWGKRGDGGRLITSHDLAEYVSPELRFVTLQQVFVFGERGGEVRLWREDDGWQARLITDVSDEEPIDEAHILWGTEVIANYPNVGFTHVREKRQQGLDHVVPVIVTEKQLEERQLKLLVRHFVEYDEETGEARIALSRLVTVGVSKERMP